MINGGQQRRFRQKTKLWALIWWASFSLTVTRLAEELKGLTTRSTMRPAGWCVGQVAEIAMVDQDDKNERKEKKMKGKRERSGRREEGRKGEREREA